MCTALYPLATVIQKLVFLPFQLSAQVRTGIFVKIEFSRFFHAKNGLAVDFECPGLSFFDIVDFAD